MSDSDQSIDHQQRPVAYRTILLAVVALTLAGCLGQATRPGSPTSAPAKTQDSAAVGQPTTDVPLPAQIQAPDQARPDDTIWPRLRRGFQLGYITHPRIEQEIYRLQRSPDAFRALMMRAQPYLRHVLDAVEEAGMPTELALLPAVESGFRAHVYSPEGAAGLWQFMPATGRMLGLEQNWWFDKRRTVRPATRAAIAYLDLLNQRFSGDWLHTLAAYNAGASTVSRAIRRASERGEGSEFWSLDLPGETEGYIPRLLALTAVVTDPQAYGLDLPDIDDQPYFAVAATAGQIDLNVAAELAGLPVEELLALNAGHKRWASRPDGPHELLLPVEKIGQFEQALASLPADKRLRWHRHNIQPGESLSQIAHRYGVTVEAIRRSNGLKNSRIRAGRDLLVPLSDAVTFTAMNSNQQARQRVHYRVRKGDSLYAIARRFQVSVAELRRWNQVGRFIRPGEDLTVFVDPDA